MKHYRIEVTTLNDGTQRFQPQVGEMRWFPGEGRFLWWQDIGEKFYTIQPAKDAIEIHKQGQVKSVEYIKLEPKFVDPPKGNEDEPEQRGLTPFEHSQKFTTEHPFQTIFVVAYFVAMLALIGWLLQ